MEFPGSPLLHSIFDVLPFAVSWATMPGAQVQYCNPAFDALFGYPPGYFKTADQLINETCIDEKQEELLRRHWGDFLLPADATGVTNIPDVEIDILGFDGEVRTVLHCGVILHEQQLAIAIYKDISGCKRDARMLREYAFLDPLTGVANRRGLQERWRDETSRVNPQQRLALLMLDLDGFKPINDTYGHQTGDAALCLVANRLKNVVRDSDLVCRLGGDEFGLLLSMPDDDEQIEDICRRITVSVSEPMVISGAIVHVTASLGGCTYPDSATSTREMLQRADMALYKAKRSGKGQWSWWTPELVSAAEQS